MRLFTMLVLMAAAFSSLLAAAHVPPDSEAPPAQGSPVFQSVQESRRLFVSLSEEQSLLGPQTLEFRLRLDGRPYLIETLSLPPISQSGPAVFELLAGMPSMVENLFRLADESRRLRIQVFLDGARIQDLSFQELVRQNLATPSRAQAVREARSKIKAFARGILPEPAGMGSGPRLMAAAGVDPACQSNCEYQLELCADDLCDGEYCEDCALEYESCLERCPCVDPKNSYTYQTSTNHQMTTGAVCLYVFRVQHAHWHTQVKYWITTTTRQRTEYCDGTYTDVPISSSSSGPVYCYTESSSDCYPDYGTASGCHY